MPRQDEVGGDFSYVPKTTFVTPSTTSQSFLQWWVDQAKLGTRMTYAEAQTAYAKAGYPKVTVYSGLDIALAYYGYSVPSSTQYPPIPSQTEVLRLGEVYSAPSTEAEAIARGLTYYIPLSQKEKYFQEAKNYLTGLVSQAKTVQASKLYYTSIGYPQYGGVFSPLPSSAIPSGFKVSGVKETETGLEFNFEEINPPSMGLAEWLMTIKVVPLFQQLGIIKANPLTQPLTVVGGKPQPQSVFAPIAGFIAPFESFAYAIPKLVGVQGLPKSPPTLVSGLLGKGIAPVVSAVTGTPRQSTEFEEGMAYGSEYMGASLAGDIVLAYLLGKAVSFVAEKTVIPKVENYLTQQYLEKGALAWKGRTESILMRLTGASPYVAQGTVGESLNMPLEFMDVAISPRSSAIYVAQAPARGLAPQIVSVPTIAIGKEAFVSAYTTKGFKTLDVQRMQSLQDAIDMAWELEVTPRSSGVTLAKTVIETHTTTSQQMVHLISRGGYVTIGHLGEGFKPLIEGLLSAPTQILIPTYETELYTYKYGMPHVPTQRMSLTQRGLSLYPSYIPSAVAKTTGKSASLLIPLSVPSFALAPTLRPKLNIKPVQRLTREETLYTLLSHLPKYGVSPTQKERVAYVPTPTLKAIQGTKTTPVLKMGELTIPKTTHGVPTLPEIPKPDIPSPPPFDVPIPTPTPKNPFLFSFERGGGFDKGKGGKKLFGKWFKRTHPIKTYEQMLKTFGVSTPKKKRRKK